MRFLVIDGYARDSREALQEAGMSLAWELYRDMLLRHEPDAETDVLLPSDGDLSLPLGVDLDQYDGMLWTGCNLTIFHHDDPRVVRQIPLARRAFERGVPAFGSCWGLQMAAVAAGGEVRANPRGREMGLARKIHLTESGRSHPMYEGKPPVFDGFISHVDEVTRLPPGGRVLSGNAFTAVQSAVVEHGAGVFWATQYHPEYDLHEMARLIVAREHKLIPGGFYRDREDLQKHVDQMEALAREPHRKDLRWQLAIDDDVLDVDQRQVEFGSWLRHVVRPRRARR